MKSAYELAMERLNQKAPMQKLSADQKRRLAEIDSLYAAKIAEREISLQADFQVAQARGDFEAAAKVEEQLTQERQRLRTQMEEEKDSVRGESKS